MKKILLVEPNFPVPSKSKNHKNFLPIGLLKIASFLKNAGHEIKLVRGIPQDPNEEIDANKFNPNEIWITSLFTYWAEYVRESVQHYKKIFPRAIIKVGGIYASLIPKADVKQYTGCDEVHQGVIPEVEKFIETNFPAYDLVDSSNPHPIDYQIIHTSRGCSRKCQFCGTWKIEPSFQAKQSIKNEIKFPKIVLYDNNFLMNPFIEKILEEFIVLKKEGVVKYVECQSGLDGRVLLKNPGLATMMKAAGFQYPRIAWDWGYDHFESIEDQIQILKRSGYKSRDISVFMIYNYDFCFEEMEKKRVKCWDWKVQIADCRYRPLDIIKDDYIPVRKGQTSHDYFIHKQWNDTQVKQFRSNVRQQNICVRHRLDFYSTALERGRIKEKDITKLKRLKTVNRKKIFLEKLGGDFWTPSDGYK